MTDQYRTEIQQMMFVAGESGDISPETTSMVERIVQQQVTELLSRADALAARRGSRIISSDDLIFLIRDDKDKVSRLLHFLSWKELRKNAKDRDDKGGGDLGDLADDADVLPLDGSGGGGAGAGAGDPASRSSSNNKTKSTKVLLPWDVANLYAEHPPELVEAADEQSSQQEDAASAAAAAAAAEAEAEADSAQLRRLRAADERTQAMTRDEYAVWAEARQASFTRRRKAKFREWAGLGVVADARVGEDVMDILGFLTFQMVVSLTEKAVEVKEVEEMRARRLGGKELGGEGGDQGLFASREGEAVVVGVRHVGEAFRRLQREGGKGAVGGQKRRALRLF